MFGKSMCFKAFLRKDKELNGLQDCFADVDFIHIDTSKSVCDLYTCGNKNTSLIKGCEETHF